MTGVDRPTRVRSGGPWFTRPVAWLLAVGVALGSAASRRAAAGTVRRRRTGATRAPVAPAPAPAPPPPAPAKSPIDAAERALVEGRFADVEALAAEPGAPASRSSCWPAPMPPAAGCRRRASASRPRSPRRPTGDAALELGFVLRDMGRREDAAKLWQAIVDDRADERTPHSIFREGRALSRARPAAPRQRRVPGGGLRGAERSPHSHRVGRALPRQAQREGSGRDLRDRAAGRSALGAGARRLRRGDGRRRAGRRAGQPRQGARHRSGVRRRAPVARGAGARRPAPRRCRRGDRQGAGGQSRPGRGAVAAGGDRGDRGSHRRRRAAGAARADAAAGLGRRPSHHRRAARRPLPLRGSGRAGAQGRGDRSGRSAHAGRDRHAPAAHRRRGRRARGARHRVPPRSVRRRHLQLAVDARHARPLRDDHHRRSDPEDPSRTKWG